MVLVDWCCPGDHAVGDLLLREAGLLVPFL